MPRDEWHKHRLPAIRAAPTRRVFIGETSVKTNMTPLRGRSVKGKRLLADAPFGKWHTQTFIAGLHCHELVAPRVIGHICDLFTPQACWNYFKATQCVAA